MYNERQPATILDDIRRRAGLPDERRSLDGSVPGESPTVAEQLETQRRIGMVPVAETADDLTVEVLPWSARRSGQL